jgi:hypothetical protein
MGEGDVRVHCGLVCANEKTAANVAGALGDLTKSSPWQKSGFTAILSRTSFPASFRQVGSALVQQGECANEQELATARVAVPVHTFRLVLRDLHRNLGLRRPEMAAHGPFMPFQPDEMIPDNEPR